MLLLLGALILGFLTAKTNLLPAIIKKRIGAISIFALVVLLFSLGLTMGSNQAIIASLPTLGWQAFLLAISTICGSLLFVWIPQAISNIKQSREGEISDFDHHR